jgi:hypothetical protein
MTPMTLMRKTMGGGLDNVCQYVLRPHFHAGGPAIKVSKEDRFLRAFSQDSVKSQGGLSESSLMDARRGNSSKAKVLPG